MVECDGVFFLRNFRNRQEVGFLAGLTPTPHQSGEKVSMNRVSYQQGWQASNPSNDDCEIAWAWLRFQSDNQLSRSYQRRFGLGSQCHTQNRACGSGPQALDWSLAIDGNRHTVERYLLGDSLSWDAYVCFFDFSPVAGTTCFSCGVSVWRPGFR